MLESGLHEAYVVDAGWSGDDQVVLTIEMTIISGIHKGEMVSIEIPAGGADGRSSADLAAVCAHFALEPPSHVPDTNLELALMGMPCTLVTDGERIGFEGSGSFANPNRPPAEGGASGE